MHARCAGSKGEFLRFLPAVLLCLLVAVPEALADAELRPETWSQAVTVVDGDTLMLEDGSEVRLVGIQAPKLPLGRAGFTAWPMAEAAKAALADLAQGRRLGLAFTGRRLDRHGRHLAHLVRDQDGLWIQGELLRRGLARVYSFADNRALVPEMLALEREARAARLGIWVEAFYALRGPEEAGDHIGSFQLVEGRVRDAARVRGRVYLNFGADWKTDFTVSISARSWKLFEAAGLAPEDYKGRRLRARGWLRSLNGPMIVATHPEQLEILGD